MTDVETHPVGTGAALIAAEARAAQAEALIAAGVKVKPLAWELQAGRAGPYYSAHDPLSNRVVEAPDEETCDAIDRIRAVRILAALYIAPDAQAALDRITAEAVNEALERAEQVAADYWREMHNPTQKGPVAAAIRAMKGGA